jgi:hypothetical protein
MIEQEVIAELRREIAVLEAALRTQLALNELLQEALSLLLADTTPQKNSSLP